MNAFAIRILPRYAIKPGARPDDVIADEQKSAARLQLILTLRDQFKRTFKQIGDQLGISRMRAAKLYRKAQSQWDDSIPLLARVRS